MVKGCFVIDIDPSSKSTIKALYFEDEEDKIPIDDNLILQLKLGHSEKKLYNLISTQIAIVSYIENYKKGKDMHKLILGVVLDKDDDPNHYRESVKMVSSIILKDKDVDSDDFKEDLEELYEEYFETPSVMLNPKEIEQRLKDRVKDYNKEGKFDKAKDLLEKIKKIPKKLYQANKDAESAIKDQDYDRAEKEYKKAYKFAKELEENEIAKGLKEKGKIVKQIPKYMEKRDKAISNAKNALRGDKIEVAYKYFREASELSKKLLDPEGTEEFKLKADALAKYHEVHKRFHR